MRKLLSKLGHIALVGGIPFLFVFAAPAALLGWYAMQPHKAHVAKAATIVAKPDTLDEDIRRCSIGLEHEKCEDAFYCSSDPVICVAVRYPSPSPEDPSL